MTDIREAGEGSLTCCRGGSRPAPRQASGREGGSLKRLMIASAATRVGPCLVLLALSGVIAFAANQQLIAAWGTTIPEPPSTPPITQRIPWSAAANSNVTFKAVDGQRLVILVDCGTGDAIPPIELNAEDLPGVVADVCPNKTGGE